GVYRRQSLPPAHIPDGGVIALTRRALMLQASGVVRQASEPVPLTCSEVSAAQGADNPHAFLGADRRAITTAPGEAIDIDSPTDLLVADAILRQRAGVLT